MMDQPTVEYESNDEVMQDSSPELAPIPVKIEGPTQVRELPALAAGFGVTRVGTTVPVMILSADPRRKSAIIWSEDQNIYLGSKQSAANTGGFMWLVNVPLSITACDEVWALADTDTTTVHVYSEVWAP